MAVLPSIGLMLGDVIGIGPEIAAKFWHQAKSTPVHSVTGHYHWRPPGS